MLDISTVIPPAMLALLIPAVIGSVSFIKEFNVTGKWLTLSSASVGFVYTLASALLPAGITRVFFVAILVGLGAAGVYDVAKLFGFHATDSAKITAGATITAAQITADATTDAANANAS